MTKATWSWYVCMYVRVIPRMAKPTEICSWYRGIMKIDYVELSRYIAISPEEPESGT
jgi:hypothetical protein